MIIEKIINNNSDKCILFFSGWAFNSEIFDSLSSDHYDIIMVRAYNNLDIDLQSIFNSYRELNLIAWSFGVLVANKILNKHKNKFKNCVAINGSLNPVSDKYGIPESIFRGTIDNLTKDSWLKFANRTLNNRELFTKHKSEFENYDILKIKEELKNLGEQSLCKSDNSNIYDYVIISNRDRIFPKDNLKSYWQSTNTIIREINSSHFCFIEFERWDELVSIH
ncbi:MAG: DUF452 family protein [Marinifilaceae bacterium]|jgi:biotin synthesis protein BioG|nr:DUF452 family protein [Marinifilaceae bacterium]